MTDEEKDPPDYEVVGGEEEATVADKLKKLREELKACRKEKDEYLAGWQRAKADFINARREEEKDRETFIKFSEAGLIHEFLKIADSLELALKANKSEGTERIYLQLKEILKRRGVTPIEAEGKTFNPSEHEALEKVEVDSEDKDNMVLEELQKGWYLHDKVLRPTKVKVGYYKITNN